jgi:hypothetical protein
MGFCGESSRRVRTANRPAKGGFDAGCPLNGWHITKPPDQGKENPRVDREVCQPISGIGPSEHAIQLPGSIHVRPPIRRLTVHASNVLPNLNPRKKKISPSLS